ncbi:hypothetical protein ACFE04_024963 [Oxalis oulophora]
MVPSFDPNDNEAGAKLLEELTSNASLIQQQVLEEILTRNAKTEYLKKFLQGSCDESLFKKKVPVVNYEDIKPYIERIANGESSFEILVSQPITELLTSSGTSGGKPKMMPSTAEDLDRKTFFYNLQVPVMNKYLDDLDQGKAMYLLFTKPEISTPSGLKARPVLTSYYKSSNFRNRSNVYSVYTSPDETILCLDTKQSMFCQLLCGLVQRGQILRVGAVFASAFLRAIKFLEEYWREMCVNIRTGHVSDWITEQGCRNSVSRILGGPNPELADLIETECKKTWEGIIKRLWPRTKYIEVIVTGSMALYIPTLKFYGGGLPLASTMYGSSESFFGINFKPLSDPADVSYTLIPNMAYFEFLPVEDENFNGEKTQSNIGISPNHYEEKEILKIVDLVDVKPGKCYELVVTTYTGLYRYRVGDILTATGFYNNSPQFKFVHRRNVVLCIDVDKTNEEDLLNAVTKAKSLIEPLGYILIEYTSYADTSSIPGHYVLFWELINKVNNNDLKLDPITMEECCFTVEEALDSVYRRCRKKDKSIGALEIRVVKHGAFDLLMDYCLTQGSSVNQYKTPRCITSQESLQILDSMVLGKFSSQKIPSLVANKIKDLKEAKKVRTLKLNDDEYILLKALGKQHKPEHMLACGNIETMRMLFPLKKLMSTTSFLNNNFNQGEENTHTEGDYLCTLGDILNPLFWGESFLENLPLKSAFQPSWMDTEVIDGKVKTKEDYILSVVVDESKQEVAIDNAIDDGALTHDIIHFKPLGSENFKVILSNTKSLEKRRLQYQEVRSRL